MGGRGSMPLDNVMKLCIQCTNVVSEMTDMTSISQRNSEPENKRSLGYQCLLLTTPNVLQILGRSQNDLTRENPRHIISPHKNPNMTTTMLKPE